MRERQSEQARPDGFGIHDSEAHDRLIATLARLEHKIDTLILTSSDHEIRLRGLEKARFVTVQQMYAFMTALLSVVTVVVYILDFAVK